MQGTMKQRRERQHAALVAALKAKEETFEAKLAHELENERERHKAAMQLAVERAIRVERANRA